MAILTDGVKYVDKRDMARLTAEMETYTQAGVCKSTIGGIFNLLLKLFRKPFTPKSLSYRAKSREEELLCNNSGQLNKCFYENIEEELDKAGYFGRYEGEEALSFAVLRTVTALHGKKNFKHMSPGELADELTLRARKINPNKLRRMPVIWFIVALIILIVFLTAILRLSYYYYIPRKIYRAFIIVFVVIELIYGLYIRRRLALIKLNVAVALLGGAYGGTFGVNQDDGALATLPDDKAGSLSRGIRAIHTLSRNLNELNLKKSELESEIKENEHLISLNEKDIRELRSSDEDTELEQRKLQDLLRRNETLNLENMQRRNTIAGIENVINIRSKYLSELTRIVEHAISLIFIDKYRTFEFGEDFFSNLLLDFEWDALGLVEKRLLEMEATNNLMALGRRTDRGYSFSFPNGQAEGCIIYNPDSRPVKIDSIISGRAPSDVNMSDEQVETTLREYGIVAEDDSLKEVNELKRENQKLKEEKKGYEEEIRKTQKEIIGLTSNNVRANEVINDMASKLNAADEDISRLKNENAGIIVEKKNLELEMHALKNNIADANDNISNLENEKRKLLDKINSVKHEDAEEIARNAEIINHLDQQINSIIKEKEELEKKYAILEASYNRLNSEYESNKANAEETVRKLNEDKEKLEKEITNKDDDIVFLTNKNKEQEAEIKSLNNSITIVEGYLKKSQQEIQHLKNSGGDPAEIAGLEATIEKLEKQNSEYQEKIKKTNITINDNNKQISKLEKDKSTLKKGIDKANERIKEKETTITALNKENSNLKSELEKAQIYEGKENRKLILDAINDADEEIDMSVPWISYIVGREDKDKTDEDLIRSIEKALDRGVRIKLRYGLGEEYNSLSNNNNYNKTKDLSYTEIKNLSEPPRGNDNQSNRTKYYVWQYHKRAKKSNGELISFKDNDHSKLMIVDKKYYIMGSLNYLSFLYGKNEADNRGELMIKDYNSKVLGDLYTRFFRFENSKPSWE